MDITDLLRVAGSAVKVADAAEDLVEFVESLGDILEALPDMDEWLEFRAIIEEYLYEKDRLGEDINVDIVP